MLLKEQFGSYFGQTLSFGNENKCIILCTIVFLIGHREALLRPVCSFIFFFFTVPASVSKMSLPVVLLSQVWGKCAQSESNKDIHSSTGQIIEQ